MKKFKIFIVLVTVLLLNLFVVTYFIHKNVETSESKQITTFHVESFEKRTINILLYTSFWNNPFWMKENEFGVENTPELKSCPAKNCRLVANRSFLTNITEFDALVFHHAQGWLVDGVKWKIPEHRSSRQLYIFAADE